MQQTFDDFLFIITVAFVFVLGMMMGRDVDYPVDKAIKAQELCIKSNSKAVSFNIDHVTCENKAVIPLKGE